MWFPCIALNYWRGVHINAPNCHLLLVLVSVVQGDAVNCNTILNHSACYEARGRAEGAQAPPLSNQNMFVFLVFHQIVSRGREHCRMFFSSSTTRRSNTGGFEFSRFEKYWSSFLPSCAVCTTIYNKSWVHRALLAWKQARYWTTIRVDWCVVNTLQSWDLPNQCSYF